MRKWTPLNKYRGHSDRRESSQSAGRATSGGAANLERCQMRGDLKTRDSGLFARKNRRISGIGSLPQVVHVHREVPSRSW